MALEPERPMTLVPGARLGGFEILAPLGAGGMGEVFRAQDTKLNRQVAIKILPEPYVSDSNRVARFHREAQAIAALNHPNIGAIYEFAESGDTKFLVLELVEGDTLADRLHRGPIPVDDALEIVKEILEALEAAHEKGICHRDLKPANVKLTPGGTVKVLDFGLAKFVQTSAAVGNLTHSPTLTVAGTLPGVILGTAGYMSPEQAKGFEADQRSDIFSFGCILYELLTHRPAFEGETASEILASVLKVDVDLTALPPRLNPRLVDLLRRCLEKNPKNRWHAAADVRVEIESVMGRALLLDEPRVPAGALQPPWIRLMPLTAALLLGGLIVGYTAWRLKPEPARTITRFSMSLPEGQQFTNTGRHVVALSPDGSNLVYIANQRLYVRSMGSLQAHAIAGSEMNGGVVNVVFAPDGQSVAFFSPAERALKRLPLAGGAPVTICPAPDPLYGISWDEHDVVFGQTGKGILRVSANGGTPEVIVPVGADQIATAPQMLPGGRAVLFTLKKAVEDWDKAQVVVQTLDTGARKRLIDGGTEGRYLPTGHLVFAVGGVLVAAPFDPRRLEITGASVPVVEGVRRGGFTGGAPGSVQFAYSASGTLVYLPGPANPAGGDWDLALFDSKGTVHRLNLPPGSYRSPRASPDGKSIAFATEDDKEAVVWVYEVAGTSPMRRLTFDGKNRAPIWSPDGQWIAFQSDREGDLAIFRQRADGSSRAAERLTKPEAGAAHSPQAWSPDGAHMLVAAQRERQYTLWAMSMADRRIRPFGNAQSADQIEAVFSPDGRWVAYQSREPGITPSHVYVQPFPGAEAKYLVPQLGGHPFWLAKRGVMILNSGPQSSAIPVATTPRVVFGRPTLFLRGPRFEGSTATRRNVDAMPDGEHVIGVTSTNPLDSASQMIIVLNWFDDVRQRVPIK